MSTITDPWSSRDYIHSLDPPTDLQEHTRKRESGDKREFSAHYYLKSKNLKISIIIVL